MFPTTGFSPGPTGNAAAPEALPTVNAVICSAQARQEGWTFVLSAAEVWCGPGTPTVFSEGRYQSLQSPGGAYDLRPVLAQLPAAQRPELILVVGDGTGRNQPRHLEGFGCPRVLLVTDSHHGRAPLRTLLGYAAEERFDLVVLDGARQHGHFWVEAGFENVHWIPGFGVAAHEQPWAAEVDPLVLMVGGAGDTHPQRQLLLQSLQHSGVLVNLVGATSQRAAALHARSLISLHCSHNGELDERIFQVLASGGFLLADRLGPEAGLERLFRDRQHLVCYDGVEDLRQKIDHYLAHPEKARRIARAGHAEYLAHHRPARKVAALMDALAGKPAMFERLGGARSAGVLARVPLYEHLQELHREENAAVVMFGEGVDARSVADAADLSRLRLFLPRSPAGQALLAQLPALGVADGRVCQPGPQEIESGVLELDRLVLPAAALAAGQLEPLLEHADGVVLAGGETDQTAAAEARLASRGFRPMTGSDPPVYRLTDDVVIGERHFAAGDVQQAARHFEAALAADPENVRALNNLGVVNHVSGETEACLRLLEQGLAIDRRDPETLLNLAEINLQLGHAHVARAVYRRLENRPLTNPALVERRAALASELPALAAEPVAPRAPSGKRILVVHNLFPPQELGDYDRLMEDFARLLRERGHGTRVLTSATPYLGKIDGPEEGVFRTLQLFGGWGGGSMFQLPAIQIPGVVQHNVAAIAQAVEEWKPDVCLFGNLDLLGPQCLSALLERNVPVVHYVAGAEPGYPPKDMPRSPLYRAATASGWLRDHLIGQGYDEQATVVYPGALVSDFAMPVEPARHRLRIAFASLVVPSKGAHVLVNALSQLAARGVDFHCTIAGGTTQPAYVEALRGAVSKAGLFARFAFPGNLGREELKDLYGRTNVLVFPSQVEETFGIRPVEAMAAGLAVVSTALGGGAEIVEHDVTGLVVPRDSPDHLATALLSLLEDKPRWARLAEAGRRRAVSRFDLQRSVDLLEKLLFE
jgi:glycosyltransferase involved in cell wall biosynthesis